MTTGFRNSFGRDLKRINDQRLLERVRNVIEEVEAADELPEVSNLYRHRAELLARLQGVPNQTLPPTGAATSVSGSSTLQATAPAADR